MAYIATKPTTMNRPRKGVQGVRTLPAFGGARNGRPSGRTPARAPGPNFLSWTMQEAKEVLGPGVSHKQAAQIAREMRAARKREKEARERVSQEREHREAAPGHYHPPIR